MKHDRREGRIPPLEAAELERRLRQALPSLELDSGTIAALHAHYVELRRWDRSVSLIGPGTTSVIVERHYAESLAALPYLGALGEQRLVDLGSGAGFPGLVLAIARPPLQVTLVESRERKAAFLEWAARKSGARPSVVCARLAFPLPAEVPEGIEFLTLRAISLHRRTWNALVDRLAPEGKILHWVGPHQAPSLPVHSSRNPEEVGFELESEVALPGGEGRRLRVWRRLREGGGERGERALS